LSKHFNISKYYAIIVAITKPKELTKMNIPEDIEEKVLSVVAFRLGARKDDLSLDKLIIDDLGADTLDHVEIIMAIEEEFGICVCDEEADRINTVGDLVDIVKSKAEHKDVRG
jgi:acyl carrier protein